MQSLIPYLDRNHIQQIIQQLATRINQDYAGESVILIGVLKGAILFVADLIRALKIPAEVEFVRLSSYGHEKTSSGTVTLVKDIQRDVLGRHLIIAEEIIDTGRTLKFLYERLQASRPASVQIVTLLDKVSQRCVEVPVKYVGQVVEDRFLIGYGLDRKEQDRNLADIYFLQDA